jgi:long-chain fatty acid transport protein
MQAGRITNTALLAAWLVAGSTQASQLQLPHVGGRDGAMSGNVVAAPTDGGSVLYFNPAGVVGEPARQAMAGLQMAEMRGRYTHEAIGYTGTSSETPMAPTFWIGTDSRAPWYLGMGLYGAVGSAYDFPAEPAASVTSRLLGELGILHLGLVAGREIAPGLRLGLQVAPSFGTLEGRTPSPLGNVRFDIDGFGIVGSVGLLYDLGERTTLGFSYRTPGVVFMRGDGRVDGARDHVEIDLHTPQNVTFGIAQRMTDRLTLTVQASWAHYPDFEDGEFEFDRNPALDQKFIADARSVFRYGAGLEYAVLDWAWLRCGVSYEPWMIEASALRPTLYDVSDLMFMVGFGVQRGRWILDFQTGVVEMKDRDVSPRDQPFFPGHYDLTSPWEFGLTVTYRFDTGGPGKKEALR